MLSKNASLVVVVLLALCCLLSGCETSTPLTADEIITNTVQAMRSISSYGFTMNETSNSTTYDSGIPITTLTASLRIGRINTTRKAVYFDVRVTSNAVPSTHQICYFVQNRTYIGNDTGSGIVWIDTSMYSASTTWYYWSRLDAEYEVLTEQSRLNPQEHHNVSFRRQADAVFNATSCYVISSYQNSTNQATGNQTVTDSYLHTYYIAINTYRILVHYATRISEIINTTLAPSDRLHAHLDAQGTITYFDYNVPVTIEAPITS